MIHCFELTETLAIGSNFYQGGGHKVQAFLGEEHLQFQILSISTLQDVTGTVQNHFAKKFKMPEMCMK